MKRKKTLILENEALRKEFIELNSKNEELIAKVKRLEEEKIILEQSAKIFENVNGELNAKNEELKKALNILQSEKDKKQAKNNLNQKKWLYGYYDEEYKDGDK